MALRTATAVLAGTLISLGAGCGGGSGDDSELFGPSPDFSEMRADFAKPTGTFLAGREKHVFDAYAAKRAASRATPSPVMTRKSVPAVSSHLLTALEISPSKTTCKALAHRDVTGTCSCAAGGAFTYDLTGAQQVRSSTGPAEGTLKMRFFRCNDGSATLDGQEFVHMMNPTRAPADLVMLLDSRVTVEKEGMTYVYENDLAYERGTWWTTVSVADGNVVISDGGWDDEARAGMLTVRDSRGTWTCTTTKRHGRCTSDKGDVREVR